MGFSTKNPVIYKSKKMSKNEVHLGEVTINLVRKEADIQHNNLYMSVDLSDNLITAGVEDVSVVVDVSKNTVELDYKGVKIIEENKTDIVRFFTWLGSWIKSHIFCCYKKKIEIV
jgi:type VI protein secretion system component Hcp